jgi:hypothetical protein
MFDLSKNPQRQFNSISEVNVEAIVNEIYTVTPISVTVVGADKKPATKTVSYLNKKTKCFIISGGGGGGRNTIPYGRVLTGRAGPGLAENSFFRSNEKAQRVVTSEFKKCTETHTHKHIITCKEAFLGTVEVTSSCTRAYAVTMYKIYRFYLNRFISGC